MSEVLTIAINSTELITDPWRNATDSRCLVGNDLVHANLELAIPKQRQDVANYLEVPQRQRALHREFVGL